MVNIAEKVQMFISMKKWISNLRTLKKVNVEYQCNSPGIKISINVNSDFIISYSFFLCTIGLLLVLKYFIIHFLVEQKQVDRIQGTRICEYATSAKFSEQYL